MTLRVVLDTNVVVSALVFSRGRLDWLRGAWQTGRILPLISRPIAQELIRVLEYPKFRLEPEDREVLLGDYLPACEVVRRTRGLGGHPRCRDPHDRMFLEVAVAGGADLLVTGDADLLALAGEFPVAIVDAEGLRTRLGQTLSERAPRHYAAAAVKRTRGAAQGGARR